MPTFNNSLQGGRAVTGNALSPRSRRASTNQANTYWSGISGTRTGGDAFGGTGVQTTTVGGVAYYYTSFISTGSFTVTSAGTFEVYSFGGGGGGSGGNGYNSFGSGGSAGGNGTITKNLGVGAYTITVGAGGNGATAPSNYSGSAGTSSYFGTDNSVAGTYGAGGAAGVNHSPNNNANGASGTDVSAFIGGGTLYKGAGGGNSATGLGGSGIGGNGAGGTATAGSAANNTASGGGGSYGSGQPLLQCGNAGAGGSGIVYIRWRV